MVKTFTISEPFLKPKDILAEGPLYDKRNNVLAWVDIRGLKVHLVDYDSDADKTWSTHKEVHTESPIGAIGLTKVPGVYIAVFANGLAKLDLRQVNNGDVVKTQVVEVVNHALPAMRFNDGEVDPDGGFIASSMFTFGEAIHDKGKLYRFTAENKAEVLLNNVKIGNGIAFTPDRKHLYFVDSKNFIIWKIPYHNGKVLTDQKEVFVKIEGYTQETSEPDGLSVSEDGDVWVAVWGTSTFRRYSSEGQVKEEYHLPVERVSCVAFAGKNFDELVITTASMRQEENGGGYKGGDLYRIKVDVKGLERFVSAW